MDLSFIASSELKLTVPLFDELDPLDTVSHKSGQPASLVYTFFLFSVACFLFWDRLQLITPSAFSNFFCICCFSLLSRFLFFVSSILVLLNFLRDLLPFASFCHVSSLTMNKTMQWSSTARLLLVVTQKLNLKMHAYASIDH